VTSGIDIAKRTSLHCQFPAHLSELEAIRSFVKFSCETFDFSSDKFIHDVQLSINEAFTNIIDHGYKNAPLPVIVECQKKKEGMSVRLFDLGPPHFLAKAISLPDIKEESGRGLAIIYTLMDEVEFSPKSGNSEWNQLHLYKRYLPT
jgi:anti-sigma regulatory factor (Ser/Thr protein kinase)